MIYLFYGTNVDKARAKWRKVGESFLTKYPSGNIFRFDAEHFDQNQFEELIRSTDLFGEKRLVLADRLLENTEAVVCLENNLKELADTGTVFALLENKVDKTLLKKLEKVEAKIEEFEAKTTEEKNREAFNTFLLTDALGARDRKRLWVLSQQALFAGLAAEEIFWRLVWQVKMMLVVTKSKGRPLKTVKPFVASKSAQFARNYSEGELEKLSSNLVSLWHDSKQENPIDFEVGLEQLILSI